VSCASERSCAAVGWDDLGLCVNDHTDYEVPVLGLRTSGRWSVRRHANYGCSHSTVGHNELDAVSCTSAAACTAVGTEVDRWDGRHWSLQPAPIGTDELSGVSCTSNHACTAVGSGIYTWNDHEWSRVPVLRPAHVTTAALNSVSCVSRESCVAVGASENGNGRDFSLVESIGMGATPAEQARQANAAPER